jgi:hypothetical protein
MHALFSLSNEKQDMQDRKRHDTQNHAACDLAYPVSENRPKKPEKRKNLI